MHWQQLQDKNSPAEEVQGANFAGPPRPTSTLPPPASPHGAPGPALARAAQCSLRAKDNAASP